MGVALLVHAMPALVPFVLEVLRGLPQAPAVGRVAVGVVVAAGCAWRSAGASVDYTAESFQRESWSATRSMFVPDLRVFRTTAVSHLYEATMDALLFDWRREPILEHARMLANAESITSG